MTNTECTCGGNACAIRTARNLVPFCQMDRTISRRELPGYGTYAAAAAVAKPGQTVRLISGGTGTGSPKRFAPMDS